MLTINIHEAKTHFSRFIEKAAAGEEIIIAKAGKPIAKLVPLHSLSSPRSLGIFKGQLNVPEDFDAALPEDVAMQFQSEAIEPSSENR
ncbi:type II toxin-antitoxin system Phd/YefM family antitoxin [Nitrosomonas sp.]|uniref:type II toxin-antitoxin system Phd/YefM family antitoxin n=1 Tax=Nitrosomonas sp. TaxID=42353 RepID=UPI00272229E8|nr:type II toxin-antitoxin system Phd/YefM family antitoxin [Nitrosomonas sp.]MDO8894547.1 type II toxin-antitoxin system Phd/YefM family antitoxin [Nitrosomonas sp.]